MSAEDTIQLIEDYLNNQLSPEATEAFQQRMQNDPFLTQEVDLHRNLLTGIRYAGRQDLKARFQTLERMATSPSEAPPVPPAPVETPVVPLIANPRRETSRNNLFAWVSGTAAMLLMVAAGSYFWFQAQRSDEQLYANYYERYDNLLTSTERSEAEPVPTPEEIAMQVYDRGDYAQAAQLLQELLNENPENPAWQLYLGICYLETDQTGRAIAEFQRVAKQREHLFIEQANWYLSLAYLKARQRENAVQTLQEIQNSDSSYREKAVKLLRELE